MNKEKDILKVGDKVFWSSRWKKTMFTLSSRGTRVYKKDNRIVGEDYVYVRLAIQDDYDMFEKAKLEREIREFDFSLLSLVKLKELKTIISEVNNEEYLGGLKDD